MVYYHVLPDKDGWTHRPEIMYTEDDRRIDSTGTNEHRIVVRLVTLPDKFCLPPYTTTQVAVDDQ